MEFERRSDDYLARKSRFRAKVFEWLRVATYGVAGLLWITYRLFSILARKLGVYRLMVKAREKAARSQVLQFALRRVPASKSQLRSLGYKPTYSELIDDLLAPRHRIPALHTMACGDFLLTDAESWHRMRGAPELPVFSMYLDALAVVTAYKIGLKVQDLPSDRVIYHVDHGSGWTPKQYVTMYRRVNKVGVPIISHGTYLRYASRLLNGSDYFLSSVDWGLSKEALPEDVPTRFIAEHEESMQESAAHA